MTKTKKAEAVSTSEFRGKTVNELIAIAKAEPAKLAAMKLYAKSRLSSLEEAGCTNVAKLNAWRSVADGSLSGWTKPQPAKPVKAKKAAPVVEDDRIASLEAKLEAIAAALVALTA